MLVSRPEKMTIWESLYLPEIMRGLTVTARHFFVNLFGFFQMAVSRNKKRKIFTVYYPEERVVLPSAYRGRPVLVFEENDTERCVACGLCEIACPARCIDIQPSETELEKERFPLTFSINMVQCVFCGFCEEVCPKEAIVMSNEFELAAISRQKLLYEKEDLLVSKEQVQCRLDYIKTIYGKCNYPG